MKLKKSNKKKIKLIIGYVKKYLSKIAVGEIDEY